MSESTNEAATLSLMQRVDLACDQFEKIIRTGTLPPLRPYLKGFGAAEQSTLLREILGLVVEYSEAEVIAPDIDRFCGELPEHQALIKTLLRELGFPKAGSRTESPTSQVSGFEETVMTGGVDSHPANPADGFSDDRLKKSTGSGDQPRTDVSTEADDLVRYFGDYELISEIARGGMGVVYRAKQRSLNRLVALKMILAGELAGSQELLRFRSEAEAAANLDHPNIVPIFEIGLHHDQHYFSMGLIEGPSLSEQLREKPLECREACELLCKVADAIQYAHEKGVVHRDLKPGNVLLDRKGEPHITDFGLAKNIHGNTELTTTGQVLGTPAYMPPEQARGDLQSIGPASDIYSLGALLYAMLTGRPPHVAGSAVETLRQVVEVEPLSVRSLNPAVPKDLETICARCLAKDPHRRFPSAGELAAELGRYLRGEPIHSRPVSRLERLQRWCKRHPAFAGLSAAVLLLTVLTSVGGPLMAWRQATLRRSAEANENRANRLAVAEGKAKEDAESNGKALQAEKLRSDRSLYARTVSLAFGQWQEGNLTVAEDMLASLPAKQRDFEWDYVNSLCHQHLYRFAGMKSMPRFVAAIEGTEYVLAAGSTTEFAKDARIYLWKRGGDQPAEIRDMLGLAATTDGRRIAVVISEGSQRLQIFDTVSGAKVCECAGHLGGIHFCAFGGRDEKQLVTVGRDKSVRVWDALSGSLLHVLETPARRQLSPAALSPDGALVAWRRADDGAIEVRKLIPRSADAQRVQESENEPPQETAGVSTLRGGSMPVSFSPDSRLLAVGGKGEVELYRTSDVSLVGRLTGFRGDAKSLAFSPNGRHLAVSSDESKVRIFDVDRMSEVTSLTGHGIGVIYGITAVAFDKSGDHVISGGADQVIKVWDTWSGEGRPHLKSGEGLEAGPSPSQSMDFATGFSFAVENVRLRQGGKIMVAAGADKSVRVIDLETKQLKREWTQLEQPVAAVDLDARGERVIAGAGGINVRTPGFVVAWRLDNGDELWRQSAVAGPIRRVAFSADGSRIAVAVGSQVSATGEVLVLQSENGEVLWRSPASQGNTRDLAMHRSGNWFATVGGEGIAIWNLETGAVRKIAGERTFISVGISEDGQRIVTGGADWNVRLYDVDDGKEIWSDLSHHGAVTALAFASKDHRIISTSIDSTTHIRDAESGEPILMLPGTAEQNLSLDVSPNGDVLAVAGTDPNVSLRRIPRSEASQPASSQAATPGETADVNGWVTLFEDRFERDALGERWLGYTGQWSVEHGAAVGVLKPSSSVAGVHDALLISKQLICHDHEVSFDVTIDQPMMVETKLTDSLHQNAVGAIFIGVAPSPFNYGEKGGALYRSVNNSFAMEASRRDGSFEFAPRRTYRFKTRREGRQLSMYIDGELYREAEVQHETPLPFINLHAMFGPLDSQVRIDNVGIRVPKLRIPEVRAIDHVYNLFKKLELKPFVLAALERDQALPKEVQHEAQKLVTPWPQDDDLIVRRALEMCIDGKRANSDPIASEDFQTLQKWLDSSLKTKTEASWRAAALCAWRGANLSATETALNEADRQRLSRYGCSHPIDAALEVLLLVKNGKPKEARQRHAILTELNRARHWREDRQVAYWYQQATNVIAVDSPLKQVVADVASIPEEDAAVLKTFVWEMQSALTLDSDPQPLAAMLAPEALRVNQRQDDDPNPFTISYEDWLETERLLALGGAPIGIRLTRTRAEVYGDAERPVVLSEFVFELPSGHFQWRQRDQFQRVEGSPSQSSASGSSWKLAKQTVQVLRMTLGQQTHFVERDGWAELDEKVEAARKAGGGIDELAALSIASRFQESLEAAQQLAKQKPDAAHYAMLVEAASNAHRPLILREAAEQILQLDPMFPGSPFLRGFAARHLMAPEYQTLRNGVRLKTPSFYKPAALELLAAGENGLAAWQPTPDCLIGILRMPKAGGEAPNELETAAKALCESREKGFSATLLRNRPRTIAGRKAAEFIHRGSGIGRALSGPGQGQPTVQRFVLIDMPGEITALLLSAYDGEFVFRDSEFEQVLQTIQVRAK